MNAMLRNAMLNKIGHKEKYSRIPWMKEMLPGAKGRKGGFMVWFGAITKLWN